jgi:hypothetical protein
VRNIGAESLFEYGSRVGFWRIMKMLEERQLPCTMYAHRTEAHTAPDEAHAPAARHLRRPRW